ncbi:Transcription intermediary factor 1-beta [Labeo rohita]|uniref:Transcription intermediary factor 1-beta n=1 Tax=Labeo rohita TaxID=84645 RepID=A0ABQ8LB98_LABRO|nr:Transcription intermediary factor 1-beta [Labeo rohita]
MAVCIHSFRFLLQSSCLLSKNTERKKREEKFFPARIEALLRSFPGQTNLKEQFSLASFDGHDLCLTCLGCDHAEAGLVDVSCAHCECMTIAMLRSRLSYMRGHTVISAGPSSTRSENASAARVRDQGDLRVTVRDVPPGKTPRKSRPSKRVPVELPKHDTCSSRGGPSISFGAPEEDMMSIAASEKDAPPAEADDSAGQSSTVGAALSEIDTKLAAMLLRVAKSIELEVPKAPSPERSRLDDWFLGAKGDFPPRPAPVPFFPEVHEELTKTWGAPFMACSHQGSSLLTTLDGGAARGYVDVPQVERAVAVHLCPQNAATWRNRPRLPSKACKRSSALAVKAYGAAGQAASALHAMAILQVYQAKALKQLHESSSDSGVISRSSASSPVPERRPASSASGSEPQFANAGSRAAVKCHPPDPASTSTGGLVSAPQPVSLADPDGTTRMVDRTRGFRCSEQLFVCFGEQQKGNAVSKQRLAHWVVDAITLAYESQGEPCPLRVRAHSTRSVASSYALAHGTSLADICRAAGWATPNTFTRFYNLRVEPVSSRVGSVSACCAIPYGSVHLFLNCSFFLNSGSSVPRSPD